MSETRGSDDDEDEDYGFPGYDTMLLLGFGATYHLHLQGEMS